MFCCHWISRTAKKAKTGKKKWETWFNHCWTGEEKHTRGAALLLQPFAINIFKVLKFRNNKVITGRRTALDLQRGSLGPHFVILGQNCKFWKKLPELSCGRILLSWAESSFGKAELQLSSANLQLCLEDDWSQERSGNLKCELHDNSYWYFWRRDLFSHAIAGRERLLELLGKQFSFLQFCKCHFIFRYLF